MTVYYVCATSGKVGNSGTQEAPLNTIQAAANLAQPGDTILVQPGIYRERVAPPRGGSSTQGPIVYKSAVPQKAIIRGSVPWQPTTIIKDILSGPLDLSVFTDTSAIDGANGFTVPSTVTPYGREGAPEFARGEKGANPAINYSLGQVFANDRWLTQCPLRVEMESAENTWWYDASGNILYVHLDADSWDATIEITNQRRVFAPHIRGLRYITVDGFVIERCSNQYPNKFWNQAQNQQAGMIGTRSGRFWTIQNNVIQFASGIGIDWGNEGGANQDLETGSNGVAQNSTGHIVKNNRISDNGAAGTASFMGKNVTFTGNIVERNNNMLFYGKQRWESAGVKVHCPTGSTFSNNIVRNNYCHGFWNDQGAGQNSVWKNNLIVANQASGINYESGTGTTGKVLNNIFDANEYNITFVTSGGCLVAHNLFLSSKLGDISTTIFNRPTDKWDSLNIEIYYNVFLESPKYMILSAPSAVASRYMNYNQFAYTDRFVYYTDSKNKVSKDLNGWISTWCVSNGQNGDESSVILEGGSGSVTGLELKVDIPLRPIQYCSRSDITEDYFGNPWTQENCVAGPFADGLSKTVIFPSISW